MVFHSGGFCQCCPFNECAEVIACAQSQHESRGGREAEVRFDVVVAIVVKAKGVKDVDEAVIGC